MYNFSDFSKIGLFYSALSFAVALLFVVIKQLFYKDRSFLGKADLILFHIVILASASIIYTSRFREVFIIFLISIPFYLAAYKKLKNFYVTGKLFLTSSLLFTIFSLFWGATFIYGLELSFLTKSLMLSGYPVLLISLFSGLVTTLEQWEVLCRKNWKRPKDILKYRDPEYNPKVCIQVPCYSEPPEIVIGTLNAISRLNYDNYEVLVIDNNTKEPSLWKPVESHCRNLGEKFRFFHVDNLKGAKAGALNHVMRYMDDDSEIIA
ncbi:MAG: glycosyltransferase, partial [Thermodesulfobacteriota bacterium]